MRLTRFAKVDVNINESRSYHQSAGIDALIGLAAQLAGGRYLSHAAVFEQKVVPALDLLRGVDEETVADCE
jgi:hypothetical protein